MKSLDDALHEAARDWTSRSTSTFADSSERLVRRLRLQRNVDLGLSGLLGLALITISWWCLGSSGVSSSPTNVTWSIDQSALQSAVSSVITSDTLRNVLPQTRGTIEGRAQPHRVNKEPDTVVTMVTQRDASLRVEHNNDGFSDEYERILARAISSEQTNRVQALNDYIGLAKLCERSGRYAHATNAWQQAASLAKLIGDERLMKSTEDAVKAAQKRIVR